MSAAITDCAHVTALDSTFDAHGLTSQNGVNYDLGPGLVVGSSNLSLRRCKATGRLFRTGYHNNFPTLPVGTSFDGIEAYGSRLVLVDCELRGGGGPICSAYNGMNCYISRGPMLGLSASKGSTVVLSRVTGDAVIGASSIGIRA